MTRFALTGARLFDGAGFHHHHALVIADGRVEKLVPESELDAGLPVTELAGGVLAPGFIDAQVNGGGGALLNDRPSAGVIRHMAKAFAAFGTTGMLPTVITDSIEVIRQAADAVAEARRQSVPGILGIHIEGPFLDPRRAGAHPPQHIRAITPADIDWLRGLDCGIVLLTVAPSHVAPETIRQLTQAGIIVSLGHSEASAAEAERALAAGARGFTHLFNAMSQLQNREPGMVGVALSDPSSYCGVIADGHHVHPLALRLALEAKPRGRLFLVTDAMPPAAGGPPRFHLQGRQVVARNGRLELGPGTLAGSILTMDEAVRNCVTMLGLDLAEALRMASLYPAAFLGIDGELGRLAPGFRANLVHLTDALAVSRIWIDGGAAPS